MVSLIVVSGGGIKVQPAEAAEINLRPGVGVLAGDQGHPVLLRHGQKTRRVSGGQPGDAAKHRHGGGEIGAVALLFPDQEPGHEVHPLRGHLGVQRIVIISAQIILNGQGLFIGRIAARRGFGGNIENILLNVPGQLQIDLFHLRVMGILHVGAGVHGVFRGPAAGHVGQIGDGIIVPGLQVPGEEPFRSHIKVEHHPLAFQLQGAGMGGSKQGGGACVQHMNAHRLKRRIRFLCRRPFQIKQIRL